MDNVEIARRYLKAIERGLSGEAMSEFLCDDVVFRELPNKLVPQGATRDLAGMREAAERGKKAVSSQRYTVRHALQDGVRVALEVDWEGTLAVPFGSLAAGAVMRASFGMFLTFRDGRIARQHNYDCFEPF